MATLLKLGLGVDEDHTVAFDWFLIAAVCGNSDAQFQTALALFKGDGVAIDRAEAYKWISVAVENGSGNALKGRELFKQELTEDELMEAKSKVSHWNKSNLQAIAS